jgi:hypothetical protein
MSYGFRVNLNDIDAPNFPNNAYRLIRFPNVVFDTASSWSAANASYAPFPGLMLFQWQIWIDAGAGGVNAQFVAKLIKNATIDADDALISGTDVVAGIGVECAQPGVAVCGASVTDLAADGDHYQLFLWASASNPLVGCTINGNPAHTFLSGFQPDV